MFDSKTGAERFPHYLYNRHANIKLTSVVVENQEIPFLNVLVKRNQKNTFSTTVYRKKTFTGLFTKWDSFTPRKYKRYSRTYQPLFTHLFNILFVTVYFQIKKLLLLDGYTEGIICYHMKDV